MPPPIATLHKRNCQDDALWDADGNHCARLTHDDKIVIIAGTVLCIVILLCTTAAVLLRRYVKARNAAVHMLTPLDMAEIGSEGGPAKALLPRMSIRARSNDPYAQGYPDTSDTQSRPVRFGRFLAVPPSGQRAQTAAVAAAARPPPLDGTPRGRVDLGAYAHPYHGTDAGAEPYAATSATFTTATSASAGPSPVPPLARGGFLSSLRSLRTLSFRRDSTASGATFGTALPVPVARRARTASGRERPLSAHSADSAYSDMSAASSSPSGLSGASGSSTTTDASSPSRFHFPRLDADGHLLPPPTPERTDSPGTPPRRLPVPPPMQLQQHPTSVFADLYSMLATPTGATGSSHSAYSTDSGSVPYPPSPLTPTTPTDTFGRDTLPAPPHPPSKLSPNALHLPYFEHHSSSSDDHTAYPGYGFPTEASPFVPRMGSYPVG